MLDKKTVFAVLFTFTVRCSSSSVASIAFEVRFVRNTFSSLSNPVSKSESTSFDPAFESLLSLYPNTSSTSGMTN